MRYVVGGSRRDQRGNGARGDGGAEESAGEVGVIGHKKRVRPLKGEAAKRLETGACDGRQCGASGRIGVIVDGNRGTLAHGEAAVRGDRKRVRGDGKIIGIVSGGCVESDDGGGGRVRESKECNRSERHGRPSVTNHGGVLSRAPADP